VAQGLGPATVLFASWSLGLAKPTIGIWLNIIVIVAGVVIASLGEIKFIFSGFMFQMCGLFFEAYRLGLIQRLLSSEENNMDPLVSLYHYAPVCGILVLGVAAVTELPRMTIEDIRGVGMWTLTSNAAVAFFLNVSSVFLVRLSPSASRFLAC
jgi:drug/metabolite transporter (DMT)-like permease